MTKEEFEGVINLLRAAGVEVFEVGRPWWPFKVWNEAQQEMVSPKVSHLRTTAYYIFEEKEVVVRFGPKHLIGQKRTIKVKMYYQLVNGELVISEWGLL